MLEQNGLELLIFRLQVRRANAWAIEATKFCRSKSQHIVKPDFSLASPTAWDPFLYGEKKK